MIDRKLSILSPWIDYILSHSNDSFNMMIRSNHLDILNRLALYSKLLIEHSTFKKLDKNRKELSFFKEIKPQPEETIENKLDQVISEVENIKMKNDQKKEKLAKAWMPSDKTKKVIGNLPPLYPKVDPNYKAPEKLPEPINDWNEE